MNIRKIIPVILIIAVSCVGLAACMNDDSANARPEATANYYPKATTGANGMNGANNADDVTGPTHAADSGNTTATTDGALNPFDWANGAADIEKAIARISEIADARVVVTNTTALVGVQFDNAYKGELTERIREMVAAEVLKADPAIQTVAVTSADEDVKKVYGLSDQIRAGRTADELSAEINSIVRNATTLR